ncbi:hypothetical protein ASD65_01855 [Microbacterium sp. Root61]|uniref:caspase family protein n=1 Tax=Microbacterium sp. Root61 TaxID=1736570 RepID=UPI0006F6DE97|nr:caspase family protein [Microbacterium sp. Root61]KRA23301.1 hypothetical protein ASD65_01855 [Microbacterium sp. Root61]
MTARDAGGGSSRRFVVAGTSTYADTSWPQLNGVAESIDIVADALGRLGLRPDGGKGAPGGRVLNAKIGALLRRIEHAARSADVVALYFTGHGHSASRIGYRLVLTNSTRKDLANTALAPRDLLDKLVRVDEYGDPVDKQPQILCVIDACYGGHGALEALRSSLQGVGLDTVWFLASAAPDDEALDGRFAEAFAKALAGVLDRPRAGPSQEYIEPVELRNAINNILDAGGVQQRAHLWPATAGADQTPPFIPNSQYQPPNDPTAVDDSRRRLRTRHAAESIWSWTAESNEGVRMRMIVDELVPPATPSRSLVSALAWAKGDGLPWGAVWVPVAKAIARTVGIEESTVSAITDEAVRRLLRDARELIVEGIGPGDLSVFRLTHPSMSALIRDDAPARFTHSRSAASDVESAIAHALIATVGEDNNQIDWPNAHPYVMKYLLTHVELASDASTLTRELRDGGFPGPFPGVV